MRETLEQDCKNLVYGDWVFLRELEENLVFFVRQCEAESRKNERHEIALEIAAYAEDRMSTGLPLLHVSTELGHAVNSLLLSESAAAQTAALEAAARICEAYGSEGDRLAREYAPESSEEIASRIRKLVTPDQQGALAAWLEAARLKGDSNVRKTRLLIETGIADRLAVILLAQQVSGASFDFVSAIKFLARELDHTSELKKELQERVRASRETP